MYAKPDSTGALQARLQVMYTCYTEIRPTSALNEIGHGLITLLFSDGGHHQWSDSRRNDGHPSNSRVNDHLTIFPYFPETQIHVVFIKSQSLNHHTKAAVNFKYNSGAENKIVIKYKKHALLRLRNDLRNSTFKTFDFRDITQNVI